MHFRSFAFSINNSLVEVKISLASQLSCDLQSSQIGDGKCNIERPRIRMATAYIWEHWLGSLDTKSVLIFALTTSLLIVSGLWIYTAGADMV